MANLEPVVDQTVNKALNKIIAKKTGQAVNSYLNHPTKSIEEELDGKKDDGYDDSFVDDELGDTNTPARLASARGLDTFGESDEKKLLEERNKVKEHTEFDIFVDYGNRLSDGDEGFALKYSIEMGGSTVGSEVHPFSWEELQKKYASEFGTAKYTVKARNPFDGKIVKTQTKHIHKPISKNLEGRSMQTGTSGETVTKTQQVMMEQFDTQRRYDLEREDRVKADLKERNDRLERSLEESRKEKERDTALMFDKIATLMQPKQQDLSWLKDLAPLLLPILVPKKTESSNDKMYEMMMKLQETSNKQIEAIQRSNEKANDKMMEMIKQIAEKSSASAPKQDSLADSIKMFSLLKGIEDAGFEKFKLMNDLANEKADEIADAKADAGGGKNDSLLDKLLLTAAPLLTGAFMGGGQKPPQQIAGPQMAPRPAIQAQVLPRPVVAPQQRGNLPSNGGVSAQRPRVHPSEGRTVRDTPTQAQTNAPEANGAGTQGRSTNGPRNFKGVSGVNDIMNEFATAPKALNSSAPATFEEKKVNVEISSPAVETATEDLSLRSPEVRQANIEKVMETITPIAIKRVFDDHATVESTATECINELIHVGVNLSSVLVDFDETTLSNILGFVPEEYQTNLKDLRYEIFKQIEANHGVTR